MKQKLKNLINFKEDSTEIPTQTIIHILLGIFVSVLLFIPYAITKNETIHNYISIALAVISLSMISSVIISLWYQPKKK